MSKLHDDLSKQHQVYEDNLEKNVGEATSTATISEYSPEILTVEMQAVASQSKLEQTLTGKALAPHYTMFNTLDFSMPTLYGKVSASSQLTESPYLDLICSYPESDKVGRKFMKKNQIKSDDPTLSWKITNYFFSQSIAAYVEENKDNMTDSEYAECKKIAQEDLQLAIIDINKKGFIVDPKTGDLKYKNPALQTTLAQAKSR